MLYLALHLIEQLVAQAQNFEHFNDRKKRRCEVCLNRMFHEHRHRLFDRMTNKLCGISAEKSGRRNSECCCTRYGSSSVLTFVCLQIIEAIWSEFGTCVCENGETWLQ